jgi:hypothetical protein
MRRGVALAQAAVNRVRQTSLRVAQILDVNRSRAIPIWKPAVYSVAAFFIACLVSLSHAPELISFKDQPEILASANKAGMTLASATELNSFAKQAVVTPAAFHVNESADQPVEGRAATPARPRAEQPRSGGRMQPTAQAVGAQSETAQPQRGERTLATQTPVPRKDSTRLLDTRFVQSDEPESTTSMDDEIGATQAIFVVTQSTRYIEAGPMLWQISVWHVTVLNRVPETRIPTKQI